MKFALAAAISMLYASAAHAETPYGTSGEMKPAEYEQFNQQLASGMETYDAAPKVIKAYKPLYPVSRLMSGKSGQCVLEFTIAISGKAERIKPQRMDDQKMCDHAIYALQLWQFEPARKQGVAAETRHRVPITYEIR